MAQQDQQVTNYSWALLIMFGLIGIGAAVSMGLALGKLDVTNIGTARSIITVVFVVGTMAIAVILVLAVLLQGGQHDEVVKRFTSAKEVLTILIGILGTIVGFYFGQESGLPKEPGSPPANEVPDPDATGAPSPQTE